jgi:hypothetical protein
MQNINELSLKIIKRTSSVAELRVEAREWALPREQGSLDEASFCKNVCGSQAELIARSTV